MLKINPDSDLLLVVDVQNDFISGSLPVPNGAEVVPVINKYIEKFPQRIFSRDMHPANHISFIEQGGPWPPHCVAGSRGAYFHEDLNVSPADNTFVSKGVKVEKDAYSAFDDTVLEHVLFKRGIKRIFICGLATDYCVKASVLDALKINGISVYLLTDAIRAVNVNPGDGEKAIEEMVEAGAIPMSIHKLEEEV
jgi:nicotinamidase/pyrazinamidase